MQELGKDLEGRLVLREANLNEKNMTPKHMKGEKGLGCKEANKKSTEEKN